MLSMNDAEKDEKMAKSVNSATGDILGTIERERYDKPQECIDALLALLKSLASAIYPFYEENDSKTR